MQAVKSTLRMLGALLAPAVMVCATCLCVSFSSNMTPAFAVLHVLTLAWVVVYVRFRPGRIAALPLSFLVSLLWPYVYNFQHPGWFQYIGTLLVAVVYALPWTLIALVIAVAVLTREKQQERKTDHEL